MSKIEGYWLIIAIMVFIFCSIWMFMSLHYRERRKRDALKREPLVSPEVRAASHQLANEATKLRAVTKSISESGDPVGALVRAMTGHRYERDH